jgi:hypothetical protein
LGASSGRAISGTVLSPDVIRWMVFDSFGTTIFKPQNADEWEIEYQQFKNLIVI